MMHDSLDRLSPALVSSDLSPDTYKGDAHFVAALGYASRQYPIASPLIRMYLSHDRAAVHTARECAFEMAKVAARRQGRTMNTRELVEVGKLALEYCVNKNCLRCHGTKFELIPGTSRLGTQVCKSCAGDGRRPIPNRHRKLITEVIARIERIEGTLDSIVAHRV